KWSLIIEIAEFGIGRFIVRTIVLFLTTFVASLLPNFGVFLDLVGSTSMTALTLVFPGLFSIYLEAADKLKEEPRKSDPCEDDNFIPTLKQVIAKTSYLRLLIEGFVILENTPVMLYSIHIADVGAGAREYFMVYWNLSWSTNLLSAEQ
ncbi:hypothetical protein GCK32_018252, partial [Trichostrongylus colubriformis]